MTPVEELVVAWEAWDEKPGSVERAAHRVSAMQALGLSVVGFQERVAELRRTGLPARDAITRTIDERTDT